MKPLQIAVLCNDHDGSPKVLAETLTEYIKTTGNNAEIYYQSKALKRLLSAKIVKKNPILWLINRLKHSLKDKALFNNLKKADAVILCDTTPHAFYRDSFDIPKFKKLINNKPVLYYAVQYLKNSPTQVEALEKGCHDSLDRYDWHLAIAPATEIRNEVKPPWNQIGMYLKGSGLKPSPKKQFYAIVDFEREGFEKYREEQIKALEELSIPYISLEKKYSMADIREIYKSASIFFIQFHEAYGMPIAECLAYGSYIGTPDSGWPMAWRMDEKLEIHGPGTLADCFMVYNGYEDLKSQLLKMKESYDIEKTPQAVFKSFTDNYGSFYQGNTEALMEVLDRIRSNNFS